MGRIITSYADIDVVEAAKVRVRNLFKHDCPVYVSFSGGKDSICLAGVIVEEIEAGNIDPEQIVVQFIDEEAIYPGIEKMVYDWREKFLELGCKFEWLCLEVRHYNCFNNLTSDESFICWDRHKKDVWVRDMPECAISSHPALKAGVDTYQEFLPRVCRDGLMVTGVRVAESVQRLINMADRKYKKGNNMFLPIYDWTNNDVWLYIKQRGLEIPPEYLYMWQIGIISSQLRISQFFSSDTAKQLIQMQEFYPDLMDRITRREPNAYLAAIYWDTEMFRSMSRGKSKEDDQKDYRKLTLELLSDIDKNFSGHGREIANDYRRVIFKMSGLIKHREWKQIYRALIAGDPKKRTLRAVITNIAKSYKEGV